MNDIATTKALAESHGLKFIDRGNGHVQIQGHGVMVNYWPSSKKRTAHRTGFAPVQNCTPWDAVKMAITNGATISLKPAIAKKVAKQPKGPQGFGAVYVSNGAGVRHLYNGKRPPWEFASMVMSEPDRIRVDAYLAHARAEQMAGALDSWD